jgi:hypothetical protein
MGTFRARIRQLVTLNSPTLSPRDRRLWTTAGACGGSTGGQRKERKGRRKRIRLTSLTGIGLRAKDREASSAAFFVSVSDSVNAMMDFT